MLRIVTSAVPESRDEPNLTNTRFCAETQQHDVCNPQQITAHGEEFAVKTRRTTAVAGPVLGEDSTNTGMVDGDRRSRPTCMSRQPQPAQRVLYRPTMYTDAPMRTEQA